MHPAQGRLLINKTLSIHSPGYAIVGDDSMTGRVYYRLQEAKFDLSKQNDQKISLNPQTSFGGYSILEEGSAKLALIVEKDKNKKALIPPKDRTLRLNPHHNFIAYMEQDDYNPCGTGHLSPLYHQAIKPQSIPLAQI